MARVSLLRCEEYSNQLLKKTIIRGLSDIGFSLDSFKGARVALKPNLLLPSKPERAIITHPEFFRAVAQVVSENGGLPVLMENPGISSLENIVKKSKYGKIVEDEGIEVGDVKEAKILKYDGARVFKQIEISKSFFDVDIIINLPKFKTHGFTYFTGAVKNLFGVIPGLRKSRMHMKVPESDDFAEWLLDLNSALVHGFEKPKQFLHIIDAITGMEGEGPGPSGTPREIGLVIMGQDPIAVDYVAVSVAGFDIKKVPTLVSGFKRDFGINSPDEIQIIGEKLEDVQLSDFIPTRSSISSHVLRGRLVGPTVRNWFVEKPVVDEEKCSLCFKCKEICPAEAISKPVKKEKTPKTDYKKCIRCFCCMEICPESAIFLKRGKLQWIMRL